MNVKTESKILLTALAFFPLLLGFILMTTGDAVVGGALLFLFFLIVLILLWRPWTWFGKKPQEQPKKNKKK